MGIALGRFTGALRAAHRGSDIAARVAEFEGWVERSAAAEAGSSDYDHTHTVNEYYDLCNQFMELGWGESLQFAPVAAKEPLAQAIARHQRVMIDKLRLKPGMDVVDIGCGFGALMRRVAGVADVRVVGINNNEHQLEQAMLRNRAVGLGDRTDCIKCNIMDMSSIAPNSFDRGYAIESTCHTPSREKAYAEIFRILKPGGLFWGQEMCMTDRFDPTSVEHRAIKQDLRRYIALQEIPGFGEVNSALSAAGFEVLEGLDRSNTEGCTVPWYAPMSGRGERLGRGLLRRPTVRKALVAPAKAAELLRILPRGSARVIGLCNRAVDAYTAGGEAGIYTPLYCFLAQKPA
ncbi:MAG: methyltransferase domain-containing protein [Acidimicrobiia bacterium]|nr:methyltransferase domain-containing protein [Acidimicrobiia bacterium]